MSKGNLSIILILSLILNLTLGGMLLQKTRNFNKQSELAFYGCCRSTSYVYEDLDNKLFKGAATNLNDSEYVKAVLSECYERFSEIGLITIGLSGKDKRIAKIGNGDPNYSMASYLSYLTEKVNKNKTLDEKDISTLKNIIAKGKLLYSFEDSGPNYNSKYGDEHPLVKIDNLYKEINKLCEAGKK